MNTPQTNHRSPTGLAVDVHGLRKEFSGNIAVDGVALQIPRGQIRGFLGPNGSGKTTTIRMICGLLKPNGGSGTALGYDILTEGDKIKRSSGYMTQRFSFWEDLSIRENLEFVGRLYGLNKIRARVDTALEGLGLQHRQKQLAGALSGGWKQRLALAAVTMHEPQLLLLDEPTAGVDPQARRDFWDEIHKLSEAGLTVFVTTHYMDEAERCDEISYLAGGRLIVSGSVASIIDAAELFTFRGEGPGARHLMGKLRNAPGIVHAAYFGSALHVTGPDQAKLAKSIEAHKSSDVRWQEIKPTLEDVFIKLTQTVGVDRRDHG